MGQETNVSLLTLPLGVHVGCISNNITTFRESVDFLTHSFMFLPLKTANYLYLRNKRTLSKGFHEINGTLTLIDCLKSICRSRMTLSQSLCIVSGKHFSSCDCHMEQGQLEVRWSRCRRTYRREECYITSIISL